MTQTYASVDQHMSRTLPYTPSPGRRTTYSIPNLIDNGLHTFMFNGSSGNNDGDEEDEEDLNPILELEDLNVELGM